jgi:hypothetical protein
MIRAVILGISVLAATAGSASAQAKPPADWCAGIDKVQVGALLAGPAPAPKQSGPAKDPDGINTTCVFVLGQRALVAVRLDFASAAEAQKKVSVDYLVRQHKGERAAYSEEIGPGDRAFWGIVGEDAYYVIVSGATMYLVGTGGGDAKPAAEKPAIVKLTTSLLPR